jgi:hypothetical protein
MAMWGGRAVVARIDSTIRREDDLSDYIVVAGDRLEDLDSVVLFEVLNYRVIELLREGGGLGNMPR